MPGETNVMRVVAWNIENLAPYLGTSEHVPARATGTPPPALADVAAQLGSPHVLCLQEVRVRRSDAELIARVRAALPGHDCGVALCDDPRNARFRGGRLYGVATYARDELGVQHSGVQWDREGRVLVSLLARERLAIVNVYAVNGTFKPYFDHELGRLEGDRHGFKRRFNRRLMRMCQELRGLGLQLLLIGDWNISRSKLDTVPRLRTEPPHAQARQEFNEEFIPGLELVDVFRQLHPSARSYTWFNRRAAPGRLDAARVDFALISSALMPHVRDAGIWQAPELRFRSDHAPLYVDLALPLGTG